MKVTLSPPFLSENSSSCKVEGLTFDSNVLGMFSLVFDTNKIDNLYASFRRNFSPGSTIEQNCSNLIVLSSLLLVVHLMLRKRDIEILTLFFMSPGMDRFPWLLSWLRPNHRKDHKFLSFDLSMHSMKPSQWQLQQDQWDMVLAVLISFHPD